MKKIKIKKNGDKSCNLFKFVSVLLSASVERVGVSRMWDFFIKETVLELSSNTGVACSSRNNFHLSLLNYIINTGLRSVKVHRK